MEIIKNNNRFNQLLYALETGWEIEEPVLLGAMWRATSENGGAYHFVLRNHREDKTTMMSLPPSSQLLLFLADNNITISPLP